MTVVTHMYRASTGPLQGGRRGCARPVAPLRVSGRATVGRFATACRLPTGRSPATAGRATRGLATVRSWAATARSCATVHGLSTVRSSSTVGCAATGRRPAAGDARRRARPRHVALPRSVAAQRSVVLQPSVGEQLSVGAQRFVVARRAGRALRARLATAGAFAADGRTAGVVLPRAVAAQRSVAILRARGDAAGTVAQPRARATAVGPQRAVDAQRSDAGRPPWRRNCPGRYGCASSTTAFGRATGKGMQPLVERPRRCARNGTVHNRLWSPHGRLRFTCEGPSTVCSSPTAPGSATVVCLTTAAVRSPPPQWRRRAPCYCRCLSTGPLFIDGAVVERRSAVEQRARARSALPTMASMRLAFRIGPRVFFSPADRVHP
jgi:hypothetical protein